MQKYKPYFTRSNVLIFIVQIVNISSYIHECKFAEHLFEVHVLGRAFEHLKLGRAFNIKACICVVVVVVNILFQTKKTTLMIGYCTA